ncbi:g7728 [Coccomyxa elongata]
MDWLMDEVQRMEQEIEANERELWEATKAKELPELIALIKKERKRLIDQQKVLRILQASLARPSGEVQQANIASDDQGPWTDLLEAASLVAKPDKLKQLQTEGDNPLFLMHRPPDAQVELCHVVSPFFDSEADRRDTVTMVLSRYLKSNFLRLKIPIGKSGQPLLAGGTATVLLSGVEYPYEWLEVKLEVGQGGADPLAENAAYFTHFVQTKCLTNCMLPGLVIEHFGCFLRVSGIANVGASVAVEPLTPALHLLDLRPHQPEYMEKLVLTLKALRLTSTSLREGYQGSAEQHGKDAASAFLGRAVLNNKALDCFKKELLRDYDEALGRCQPMTEAQSSPRAAASSIASAESATDSVTPVQENLEQANVSRDSDDADVPQKLLYKLVEPDGGDSVVKFATRYSEEAHRALAAQELAPELLEVRQLPGGWFQIHMELLDAPWCSLLELLRSEDHDVVFSAWKAAEEALARAHAITLEEGQLVWGDARPSNFRLRRRDDGSWDVRLIDFDWSGVEGRVCYPGYLNSQVPWAAGVASHRPILQAHDIELLNNTLGEELLFLREKSSTGSATSCAADPSNAGAQSSSVSGTREAETPIAWPAESLERNTPPAARTKKNGLNPPAAKAAAAAVRRIALPALPRQPPPQLRQHKHLWRMQAGAALAHRHFLI